ncbi:Secreted protein containing C-terminal beta-propeller domain [Psychrobacillus sp. OK028]|uniref:beta-propeller domain-containing protein n=1 Tax=Psychrobacillus sp. OK028 TaxID=1884359 RepID=UPI00088EC931|nr:beta-propeller domain-containing protein [Psychrobacillus sp. OK028]SDN29543.1 Secreted protein containing C-terminal beta-propeller domain [Psychrobacillus sp. OK028]
MKRWIISIAALVLVVGLGSVFYFAKLSVTAQSVVLSGEVFRASFSSAIGKNALENGDVYIEDQLGKKVNASYSITSNGKSLEVTGLNEGKYTLHVKDKLRRTKTDFPFHVYKELPTVQSQAELKAHFEMVMKLQNIHNKNFAFPESTEESAEVSSDAKGGGDYSTTNNQVEGVDEADIVKTNGTHIYSITENNVSIVNIEDPTKMKEETKIRFGQDYYPMQLFLTDKTLIVLAQKNSYQTLQYEEDSNNEARMYMPMNSMTTALFYDISNPSAPKLQREVGTEGNMSGARLTDDTLYYVTNVYPNFWIMEEQENIELRPFTYDSKSGETVKPLPYKDLSILPNSKEATYSIITALDVTNPKKNEVMTKGYLGGSEQLYMSKDNLFLTSSIFEGSTSSNKMIWNPGSMDTEVFKFALNKTAIQFVASNRLKGHILNQFSMDEYNGYLRAVTTKGNSWDENEVSENNLFILDDGMKLVGSLTGLAKDERIYSARFMGDKAYMVTFKETDPLFVIDTATPTSPKVLGELKIPGFSNYLHPLDENHLIGFGYETKIDTQNGGKEPLIITEGMKISLFDVSDFANPKEKDTEIIGDQGTYSPLQYDHHALFEHQQNNLYGFPVSIYEKLPGKEYSDFKQDGALIYEITPENGIQRKGDLLRPEVAGQMYEEWESSIQRIVYAGDTIYTIAIKEIKSYNIHTYKQTGLVKY